MASPKVDFHVSRNRQAGKQSLLFACQLIEKAYLEAKACLCAC